MDRYQNFELRLPSEEEFNQWFEISLFQQAEDRAFVNNSRMEEELLNLRPLIAHILPKGKDTPNHYFRVLSVDGIDNVGFIWLGVMPGLDSNEIMLMDIIIKKEYRRQGLGKLMLLEMHKVVKLEGYQRVLLYVLYKNPAQFLYSRLGYRSIKENEKSSLMAIVLLDNN